MHEDQEVVTKECTTENTFHSYHHKVVSAVQSGSTSFSKFLDSLRGQIFLARTTIISMVNSINTMNKVVEKAKKFCVP